VVVVVLAFGGSRTSEQRGPKHCCGQPKRRSTATPP
jgi:hypothetical protein